MEQIIKTIDEELNLQTDIHRPENNVQRNAEGKRNSVGDLFTDDLSTDKRLLRPFSYLMINRGKNFRESLIIGLNYWYKAPKEVVNVLSKAIYVLHNCTLMVDDIQDASILRRGIPCSYLVYGTANTLNSFRFLISNALAMLLTLEDPQVIVIFYEVMAEIIRGQAMDVYWRDNSICPTEEEYKLMILRKTGALLYFVQQILQHYSKENVEMTRLLTALSFYFQINDDYLNLWDEKYQQTKGFCEDISEGKFSFPVVYVVRNYPKEGKVIKDILRQRTHDVKLLTYCRSIIEKCGAYEYTKRAIDKYKTTIMEESSKLVPNSVFNKQILCNLLKLKYPVNI